MIKAEQMHWYDLHVSNISATDLKAMNSCIDRIEPLPDTSCKPLICKCCGAPINRETMTCEYCGVQYGKGKNEH